MVVRDLASGRLRDLAWVPDADVEVEPVSPRSPDGSAVLRHSTAHVLAQAVQDAVPRARSSASARRSRTGSTTTSPSRAVHTRRTSQRIEKQMQEIIKAGQRFRRRPITDDEARVELADEPFKLELIDLKGSARRRRGASGGRRRRADHLRQRRRHDR